MVGLHELCLHSTFHSHLKLLLRHKDIELPAQALGNHFDATLHTSFLRRMSFNSCVILSSPRNNGYFLVQV